LRFAGEKEANAKKGLDLADCVTGTLGGKGMLRAGPEGEKYLRRNRKREIRTKCQTDHLDARRVERSKVVAWLNLRRQSWDLSSD
jgi:hypothetical protein